MSCNDRCFYHVNCEPRTRSLSFAHALSSLANTPDPSYENILCLNITALWAKAHNLRIGSRLSLCTPHNALNVKGLSVHHHLWLCTRLTL